MLLFSWKKILKDAGMSSGRVLTILEAMLSNRLPRNRYDPLYRYYYKDYSGNSYLINPFDLLSNKRKWRLKEIADYVGLASFRNLAVYKLTGDKTLDLAHCPVSQDALSNNRLLRLENNKIHFYYEDYTGDK
jgi:hypothetical protein